jgi:hypothetical protein
LILIVDVVVFVVLGGDKSNKSAVALAAGWDLLCVDVDDDKRSPNPPRLLVLFVFGDFGAAGGDLGTGSKKLPPLNAGAAWEVVAFAVVNPPVRPANADGFGTC